MSAAYLEPYADRDSWLHRLDPRPKLVAVFLSILLLSSAPVAAWPVYGVQLSVAFLLALSSRVPARFYISRLAAAAPFVLGPASLPIVSRWWFESGPADPWPFALTVAAKGFGALLLLAVYASTTRLHHTLWAMRRLHMPEAVYTIAGVMARFTAVLLEEWRRTTRARDCRAPRLTMGRASVVGKQIGGLLLRNFERSERLHGAMQLRGYRGSFVLLDPPRMGWPDTAAAAGLVLAFAGARFLPIVF